MSIPTKTVRAALVFGFEPHQCSVFWFVAACVFGGLYASCLSVVSPPPELTWLDAMQMSNVSSRVSLLNSSHCVMNMTLDDGYYQFSNEPYRYARSASAANFEGTFAVDFPVRPNGAMVVEQKVVILELLNVSIVSNVTMSCVYEPLTTFNCSFEADTVPLFVDNFFTTLKKIAGAAIATVGAVGGAGCVVGSIGMAGAVCGTGAMGAIIAGAKLAGS